MELKGNAKVTFIACGSADITLIEYQNHYSLIDTGEDTCRENVISYLENENIKNVGCRYYLYDELSKKFFYRKGIVVVYRR